MEVCETRGMGLARRLTDSLGDLSNVSDDVEKAIQRLGGNWPWPEPQGAGSEIKTEVDSFQGAIATQLDRLSGLVTRVQILRDRLVEIV